MRKIAVLTRDCAGINACIRAIVRTASFYGIEVWGVIRGYEGLIDGNFIKLSRRDVSGIINQGGTILKTARSQRFLTKQGQNQAVRNLKKKKIDGLVVIGGNGSLRGAYTLAYSFGVTVVGIPATIDNDVNGVDLSLGADTAVNVALDALDKIRDTATSLERIFVVEVMGRDCGYIALNVALAGGCEEVLLPEKDFDCNKMCEEIKEGNRKGKVSWIIIVAEGKAKASDIAAKIREITHLDTRVVVLGHIQRGGRPTCIDRILGARLGSYAVELLRNNKKNICVTIKDNKLINFPLKEVTKVKRIRVKDYYRLIKILT